MVDIVKEFATKKIDLLKMEMTEKSSITVGTLTYLLLGTVAALFFIILFNIGMGLGGDFPTFFDSAGVAQIPRNGP